MNIYKHVFTLVSFAFAYSHAYAMDNNKPKPPTPINFNGTLKPTEFKSTLNYGGTLKPTEFKSNLNWQGSMKPTLVPDEKIGASKAAASSSKPSAVNLNETKFNTAEFLETMEQKKRAGQQAIDQFSATTSKNNSQAAELVTAVLEKMNQGKELTADEVQILLARLNVLQLNNQQAADEAKKALN